MKTLDRLIARVPEDPSPEPSRLDRLDRPRRARLHFKGRSGDRLVWERALPNDSRVESISANADWFYGTMRSSS